MRFLDSAGGSTSDFKTRRSRNHLGSMYFGALCAGADLAEFLQERPGMSAFVLSDGAAYHTYSAYARGLDGLWGAYQWLDRAPLGRNGDEHIWVRHDEYERVAA